jgi:hypothetical protein
MMINSSRGHELCTDNFVNPCNINNNKLPGFLAKENKTKLLQRLQRIPAKTDNTKTEDYIRCHFDMWPVGDILLLVRLFAEIRILFLGPSRSKIKSASVYYRTAAFSTSSELHRFHLNSVQVNESDKAAYK